MSTANQFEAGLQRATRLRYYEFGPFLLDTIQHALLKEGQPIALTPKTYDTLLVLVQNSGRMLSKDELMKTLWPDSFVEESNLAQQVSTIRKALSESPGDPRFIVTIPGRGYRFAAQVRSWGEEDEAVGSLLSTQLRQTSNQNRPAIGPAVELANVTADPESVTPLHSGTDRKASRSLLYASALILLIAAITVVVKWIPPPRLQAKHTANPPATAPRRLAILPLQNIKQDPHDDFLGFSLTDAIITKLDYVSSLTVRPSTSVQKYRNQIIDIQKVATELSVDTLLTGSYIRDGNDLRITYQLIDVKSDKILGRGTIDLKYDRLLRVQDNVAQQVIKELELNLSPSEAEKIKPDAPVNPLAYEYYLRGVDLHGQHKFPMAIKMLEKSTEIDPNYAPAWAYLGASYNSDAAFEFGGREQYHRAQAAYERALAIQPSQLDAQIFLANLLIDTGKVEQAMPLLQSALKTNPNQADVHWELGYAYRFAGMLNESVAECERARQIDPLVRANGSVLNAYLYVGQYQRFLASLPEVDGSSFLLFYRGLGEYYMKDFDRAAKDFDRAYELDPSLYAQIGKALSDAIASKGAEGLELLHAVEKRVAERGVGDGEATYKIAQAYAVLGDKMSALRVLRSSIAAGFFAYPYLASDPLLDPIRDQPEFAQVLGTTRQRYETFKNKFF